MSKTCSCDLMKRRKKSREKAKTCLECEECRRIKNEPLFVLCREFGWKIAKSVAKTQACCKEDDKHHIFPQGKLAPIRLYNKRKVML